MFDLSLPSLICRVLILLIVFPAHEFAHAFTADRLGDPTPRMAGRLTLNPIKHLSLFGSLLFIVAGIGWASTPVNPAYFGPDWRKKMGLVSLTGPLTNLGLAVLGVVPFYVFGWLPEIQSVNAYFPDPAFFFTTFIVLNLLLASFNLLPIAPLDGAQVLGAVLPPQATAAFDAVQRYGMMILLVLVFVLPYLGVDLIGILFQIFIGPMLSLLFIGVG